MALIGLLRLHKLANSAGLIQTCSGPGREGIGRDAQRCSAEAVIAWDQSEQTLLAGGFFFCHEVLECWAASKSKQT